MLGKLLLFLVFVVGEFGLIRNAICHLAKFDTTCKQYVVLQICIFFQDFWFGLVEYFITGEASTSYN
jgi:hypothetical protein